MLLDNDPAKLADLRRVEATLADLVRVTQWDNSLHTRSLQELGHAEELLAAGRYHDAIDAFENLVRLNPGSSLAFMANFQMGRIALEKTQDYDLAFGAFSEALRDSRALSAAPHHRKYLEERVTILREGRPDNWATVGKWQEAQRAVSAPERLALLLEVVEETPSPLLAAEAAEATAQVLVADVGTRQLDHHGAIRSLGRRADALDSGPEAARIYVALADIAAHRSQNLGVAMALYRRAREVGPDAETARTIESALGGILRQRVIGILAGEE